MVAQLIMINCIPKCRRDFAALLGPPVALTSPTDKKPKPQNNGPPVPSFTKTPRPWLASPGNLCMLLKAIGGANTSNCSAKKSLHMKPLKKTSHIGM